MQRYFSLRIRQVPPIYLMFRHEYDVTYIRLDMILARQIIDFWSRFPDAGEKLLPKRFDFHGPISWYRFAARCRLLRRYLSGLMWFNSTTIFYENSNWRNIEDLGDILIVTNEAAKFRTDQIHRSYLFVEPNNWSGITFLLQQKIQK